MPYPRRAQSEADLFHVVARGVGRQIIFEDDDDRSWFVDKLARTCRAGHADILAYCLMDNHVHLVLHVTGEALPKLMQELLGEYARRFNERHDRVGHLFQSRFKSEPIDSETYLLQAVRYVHRNPETAGIALTQDYRWSSYREYLGARGIADTGLILAMFSSLEDFVRFHSADGPSLMEPDDSREEGAAKRALAVALGEFGDDGLSGIKGLPRPERDAAVRRLCALGLSVRQVERLTGVSRSVVASLRKGA